MKFISDFLESTEAVQSNLRRFENDIDERRSKVLEILERLEGSLRLPESKLTQGPLRDRLEDTVKQIHAFVVRSREQSEEFIKSQEFITQFDSSLIVIIYGKVNSGKSSLGNFIGGVPFENLPQSPYHGRVAEYVEHDASGAQTSERAKSKQTHRGFPTDATECTDNIRSFTLGGLTWVDTPGIHSMTQTNEDLAKQYVDNAELVIFLTSSDSLARASEMEELKKLMDQGKSALIVVSKFDKVEEDVDDQGNIVQTRVPKSVESRSQQEGWLEEQIAEAQIAEILQDRSYSFVSTLLAETAVKNNSELEFELSGMASFYKQLTAVMNERAVELKKRTPKAKFNTLIKRINGDIEDVEIKSLPDLIKTLQADQQVVEHKRQELERVVPVIAQRAQVLCSGQIEVRLVEAMRATEEGRDDSTLESDVQMLIAGALSTAFKKTMAELMQDVMKKIQVNIQDEGSWSIPPINTLEDEVEVSQREFYRSVGGTGAGLAGSIAGGIFFGVPGAIIGGMLSAAIGKAAGSALARNKTFKVNAGTNVDQVRERIFKELDRKLPQVMKRNVDIVDQTYFEPLQQVLLEGIAICRAAQDELDSLRYPVGNSFGFKGKQ
jgi:predicted GTPase